MRIIIDMQGAQSDFSGHRGVGRYTRNIAQSLLQRPREHEIILGFNTALMAKKRGAWNELLDAMNVPLGRGSARFWQQLYDSAANDPHNRARELAAKLTREAFLNSLAPDVIFSTNLQEGMFDPAPTSVKLLESEAVFCSTLHDLTPLRFRQDYLGDPVIRAWYEEKIEFAKNSDLILTVSEHSKADICELLDVSEERIGVVYNAFDQECFKPSSLTRKQGIELLARYGIPPGFILYTGGGDQHKNLQRLLEAYAILPSALQKKHRLVMVGKRLEESLANAVPKTRSLKFVPEVIFTGYVPDEDLRHLYSFCELFIFPSIYEGFGLPMLEAMACGAPVICSNTSSMPEVVEYADAMFDPYDINSISHKIEQVLEDKALRAKLKIHGAQQAEKFSWDRSANTLLDLFELHFQNRNSSSHCDPIEQVITCLSKDPLASNLSDNDLVAIATSLEQSFPSSKRKKKFFVDVSAQVQTTDHTGIQRVTRALAQQLHQFPPESYEVTLVYTQPEAHQFFVAGSLIDRIDGNAHYTTAHTSIEFYDGDILFFLDLHPMVAIEWQDRIQYLRTRGVKVYHVVYDLIPHTHPHFFWPDLCEEFESFLFAIAQTDGVFCISRAVAEDMRQWFFEHTSRKALHIGWFHLGADLENSLPSHSFSENSENLLLRIKNHTTFLMVGTIEPRKGHAHTLAAFEQLWNEDREILLIIVGKLGWGMENLVNHIQSHREFGKRLFWLSSASDDFLYAIYQQVNALIAASEAEGFGLPLIEAARHKLPIIARDIPVFREVAGEYAYYFDAVDGQGLAESIHQWLILYRQGQHPKSDDMPWLTWKESAQQLLTALEIPQSQSIISEEDI